MWLLQNLVQLVFSKPGTSWVLGNVTPGAAMLALMVPFVLGFVLAFFVFRVKH